MAGSRDEQVAAFYAQYARGLEGVVGRQVRDPETAADACQRAWEQLLERPDVRLDRQGFRWLATVAVRSAWREARDDVLLESLDVELPGGASVGEVLVGRDDDVDERLEARAGLELVAGLPVDQRRALGLGVAGHSRAEIAAQTGWSVRKVDRCLSKARAALRELTENPGSARPDPVVLLEAARARRAELVLERAEISAAGGEELERRIARVSAAVRALGAEVVEGQVRDPPAWAGALLGEPPGSPAKARLYEQGVRELAGYRVAHGVRASELGLGLQPMPRAAREAFARAQRVLAETRRALGLSAERDAGRLTAGAQQSLWAGPARVRDVGVDR